MADALTPMLAAAALVLCVAGVAKLRSPGAAVRALATLGVPTGAGPVRLVAAGELGLGVLCLLHPSRPAAAALSAVYATFAGIAIALKRRRAACGCFGDGDVPASGLQAALSAVLALASLASASAPPHGLAWMLARPLPSAIAMLSGIAGAAYGGVLVYTELPRAWRAWGAG